MVEKIIYSSDLFEMIRPAPLLGILPHPPLEFLRLCESKPLLLADTKN